MAALEAVRRLGGERRIAFYEVGAPGRPNALIDITSVLEKKRAAMRCFVSQLRHQRYDEQIEALNRYRAYTLPREVEAVEAFELVDSQSLRHGAWLEILASEYRRRQTLGLPVLGGRDLPLVSILIRSTGRATLAEALDSLAVQTYPNIEVVLVDAGGNSLSADLAAGNVRLIATGQPLSRSQAANAALAAARGAWLLFLDDDDYLAPDHVSRLVEAVSRDARLIAAYSDVVCVDAARQPIGKRFGRPFDHSLLLARNFMPIHAVLFSHAAVEAGCRFDERLDVLEDWDFWLQVAQLGEMRHVAGETAYYRIHAGGGWGVSDQAEKARVATIYVHDKWRHLLQGAQLFELMETVRRADDQLQGNRLRRHIGRRSKIACVARMSVYGPRRRVCSRKTGTARPRSTRCWRVPTCWNESCAAATINWPRLMRSCSGGIANMKHACMRSPGGSRYSNRKSSRQAMHRDRN